MAGVFRPDKQFGLPDAGHLTLVDLERVRQAREKIALLIYQGEDWLLPHFARLNQEVEALEMRQTQKILAMAIAEDAMAKKSRS
ncbi:hypothetical protein FDK21_20145 [Cohaesibacter sp. CAU 1516]|uniref:hypothetical protein n=1 Tax=Cohaesibacter sp. CAU 1516 TaxID=2576038 RepID=UPI0010FE7C8C|nr:hypothetical protein [Cohaesibacter sp. CAU 1516]TLP42173.1 hypothetical protein FDK21_20145 [Cohaesibacter sp. CAU 1516]